MGIILNGGFLFNMIESTIQTVENQSFVGLANEPPVYKDFYRKCFFTNFTPRSKVFRFSGMFEGCTFNKAEFKLCTLSGQFFNCTFVGVSWIGASIANSCRFINCDFSESNILAADGFQNARFNKDCKNLLRAAASRSLILVKEGEYKISDLMIGPPIPGSEFLPSRRGLISRISEKVGLSEPLFGPKRYYDSEGLDWDEDTRPGIPIRHVFDRKAHLQSNDLEEYKRNCGK